MTDFKDLKTWAPEQLKRFLAKIDIRSPNECWLWTAAKSSGYGRVQFDGKLHYAHRLSYKIFVGPIPDGLQLDHLCRTPACVNFKHLEPVTMQENIRRSPLASMHKTHCLRGHEFTPENTTYVRRFKVYRGKERICMICQRRRGAEKRKRNREK